MATLIDDPLNLSRISRSTLGREPVNLTELAQGTLGCVSVTLHAMSPSGSLMDSRHTATNA